MINIPLHQQRWESDCSTRWSNLIELSPILFSWRLNFSEIASRKINLKTTLEVEKTEVKPGSCRESRKLGSEQCSGRFHSEDLGGPKPGGKKLLQCNTFDAWNHPKGRRESVTVTAEQVRPAWSAGFSSSLSMGLNIRCSPRAYTLKAGPQSGAIWS